MVHDGGSPETVLLFKKIVDFLKSRRISEKHNDRFDTILEEI
jgi:hypothetical protein